MDLWEGTVLDSLGMVNAFLHTCIEAKADDDEGAKLWLANINVDSKCIVQVLGNGLILTDRNGKALYTTEKLIGCKVTLPTLSVSETIKEEEAYEEDSWR